MADETVDLFSQTSIEAIEARLNDIEKKFGFHDHDGRNSLEVSSVSSGGDIGIELLTYTASGTWTKQTGLKFIEVEVVGGGGGGGSSNSTDPVGGGGGGGGYCRKRISAENLNPTETVTIGAGGGANSDADGTAGGDSSFGSHATAGGGGAGLKGGTGGAGGTATGGDLNMAGGAGKTAVSSSNYLIMPYGGDSGGGYGNGGSVTDGGATSGAVYGGGGGGCCSRGTDNGSGASGAQGVVIVREYYN